MPAVQLFATCLGDLAFPDAVADAESLLRRGGVRRRVSGPPGVLRAAGVQLGAPRGGAAGGALVREGVLARAAGGRALGVVRDDGVALPPGAPRGRAVRGLGAVGLPRRTRASGRCRGTTGGGSPTTTRATCSASSRISDAAAAAARRVRRGARPVRAAGPLLRVRRDVLGAPARGLAGDGGRQARGRRRGRRARHRRPGLPDAPARARASAPARRCRVVHLATALARGVAVTGSRSRASRFREIARGSSRDAHTQAALDPATGRLMDDRMQRGRELPDVEALRDRAHDGSRCA